MSSFTGMFLLQTRRELALSGSPLVRLFLDSLRPIDAQWQCIERERRGQTMFQQSLLVMAQGSRPGFKYYLKSFKYFTLAFLEFKVSRVFLLVSLQQAQSSTDIIGMRMAQLFYGLLANSAIYVFLSYYQK